MDNYSKVFTKKLIALFLSVLMALSCFTGALSAYAASVASDKDFHDGNLASNFMAWAETTDEQTCEALLDWADMHLDDLMTGLLGDSHLKIYLNAVVLTIDIDAYLDSVDGLFDLLNQVDSLLTGTLKTLAGGDIKNINLDPVGSDLHPVEDASLTMSGCGKSYRSQYSAKELILALARFLEVNSNDVDGKNVIGNFLKGSLDLGTIITGVLKDDVYGLLQGALGMWDGYEWNLVYNIVANLILENTKWFDNDTLSAYKADIRATNMGGRTYAFNFDDVLMTALSDKLLAEIHAEITYPNYVKNEKGDLINDSSVQRYNRICKALGVSKLDGTVDQTSAAFVAAAKNDAEANNYTYNPNIIYFTNNTKDDAATADMDLDTGCVFLFQKRNGNAVEKIKLNKTDNLFDFAFSALSFAWETALEDTLGLIHVNYNVNRGYGANYDNKFFYWKLENGGWDYTDWKSNYSAANVEAWAAANYNNKDYYNGDAEMAATPEEFLAIVKHTFSYDRSVVADPKNNWQDIDPTTLFNKLRYNPLADLYFDMQTGPINLYLEQTGIKSVSEFFDTAFTNYDNMVAGLNDALVSVTEVLFPNSDNIGYQSVGETDNQSPAAPLTVPTMKKTGNTIDNNTIASTLISNVVAMFEYAANAADANILNPYYAKHNITTTSGNLSEGVFEEAMIPLLIACLQQVKMTEPIHDEKWDSCKDAEGVAIVALEEYLSYVLPDKDYSVLWTKDADGFIVANSGQNLFENAIMPMARDALGYIISSVVPCRTPDGAEWNVYDSNPTDSTTIFEILNTVVCYYASQDNFSDGTSGKAVATLLGVVNENNEPLVTMNNDLWTNLDHIINTLLPFVGTFQYGTVASYGKASSKDLIYNDLIQGILDIGTPKENGDMGVTNILKRIITIITADPISANKATPHDTGSSINEMLYNVVADLLNTLLGSRTDNRYATLVPYADYYDKDAYNDTKTATPFDSLLATSTLGHFSNDDGKDTGMLGMLIYNIFKAFGGNGTTTGNNKTTGTQGCWTGAMFAVEAVNNFIPSFCKSLGDHTLNTATAEVANASQSGLNAGSAIKDTTLDITNNSIGLNRFYRDASGNVQRRPRYFVYVRDINQTSDTGSTLSIASYDRVIQPEKTLRVGLTGSAPANPTTITFDIKYAIFEAEMNGTAKPTFSEDKVVEGCSNLHTTAYMYLTTDVDWASTVYDGSGHYQVQYYTGTNDANKSNTYTHTSPAYGGSNVTFGGAVLLPTFPNDFIVPMSNAQSVNNKCFYVKNVSNGTFGQNKAFDGVYSTLMAGDQYYPVVNGTTISDTLETAPVSSDSNQSKFNISDKFVGYAAIDRTNGDILNYNRWDYTTDNGATWNRGPVIFDDFACGFSQNELNSMTDADVVAAKENGTFGTRIHVAWTLQEAMGHGIVKGVQRTKSKYVDGVQHYVYDGVLLNLNASYMKEKKTVNGNEETVGTKLLKGGSDPYESITWGTPTPGLYFAAAKTDVEKGGEVWCPLLTYDGSTALSVDSYPMGIFLYTTENQNMVGKINMHIADDSGSTTLKREYNEALATYSTYSAEDVTDVTAYNNVADALKSAVKTISTPINTDNAAKLGSTMVTVPKTNNDTSTVGDKAYKPIPATTDIDPAIQANAVKGAGSDGVQYWFYNKECTIPVCSNEPLTAAEVTTSGTKKVLKANNSMEVTLVDGVYYYVNTPQYVYEWALPAQTGYATPYMQPNKDKQATNSRGDLIYDRMSFTCYDQNGKAMDSRGKWTYIIADRKDVIKENDGNDYRGVYQKDIDNLMYYIEQLKKNVNTEVANVIHDNVTVDRTGMNSVNYEVASYEKMVQIARDAESLIWTEPDGDPTYYVVGADGQRIPVTLSDQSTSIDTLYEDASGTLYKDSEVKVDQKYKYVTDKSLTQLNAGVLLYNEFKGYVQSRGYIGDKLEAEINCATGYDYTALDFTKTTEPAVTRAAGDPVVTDATITSATATDAKYGTWENGTLVNKKADGTQAYTDASWKNYVIALANGIEVADNKTDLVSSTYTAKTAIQIAENNLEEFVEDAGSDMITVKGTVTIATDIEGTQGTTGIVDLTVATADGAYTVQTAADGTFELSVPTGTTELVVSGHSAIARTVKLSGTQNVEGVVIPVNICDYVKDDSVDSYDKIQFNKAFNGGYDVYYDLVKDGLVDSYDKILFNKFVNKNIVYAELVLD